MLIIPGGADESLLTVSQHNHISVRHKGFIRFALQTGIPIVPVYETRGSAYNRYSFGENNLWTIPPHRKPIKWLNDFTK